MAVSFYWKKKQENPEETADLQQVADILSNMYMYICINVYSGWRHVIISTVLKGRQLQIGPSRAST